MAQQQYQTQGIPFSPPQTATSPGTPQSFGPPPPKRQRLSPGPVSQLPLPYVQSPYGGMSPNTTASSSATASPHFSNIALPQNAYNTPYSNGQSTPTITLPNNPMSNVPNGQPSNYTHMPLNSPQANGGTSSPYSNTSYQNNYIMPPQGPGMMGPPSKPVERESGNEDQMDALANAGIDLKAEESFAMSLYSGSYNTQPAFSHPGPPATGHGFTQFPPANVETFYGAGPANQIGQSTDKSSQDELSKKAADRAWADAAHNLARSRQHELNHPHVHVAALWTRMDKIARENGLMLNCDPAGKMPQFKLPSEFRSEVRVQTAVGPDEAMTVTSGGFLPADTALADQLALMSLATNLRLRTLLEEAVALGKGRRVGSNGTVTSEWANAATSAANGSIVAEGAQRNGWESAVSPHTHSLKRSFSTNRLPTPVSEGAKTPAGTVTFTKDLAQALRSAANSERDFEEERLAKRERRNAGGTPRNSSIAPGTPGSVAPEPGAKPLTKKEREKLDKGRQNVIDVHAQANAATNTFLFGASKKKKYAWMNSATGSGSGTSTPNRSGPQLPGTPGIGSGGSAEKQRLTTDGKNRMGGFREDKESGNGIQLRDWLAVLENDGKERKSLQKSYAWLEQQKPRPQYLG